MRHAVFLRDNSSEGGHWFDSRFLARWVQYRAINPLTRRTLNHNELTRIHTAARRPSSNSNSNSNSHFEGPRINSARSSPQRRPTRPTRPNIDSAHSSPQRSPTRTRRPAHTSN